MLSASPPPREAANGGISAMTLFTPRLAALALARLMSSMLYGVSADDPISLLVGILVLSVAALLACLLPALRATRIDPIAALRE